MKIENKLAKQSVVMVELLKEYYDVLENDPLMTKENLGTMEYAIKLVTKILNVFIDTEPPLNNES